MTKKLLFLFLILFSFSSFSQNNFQKSYMINNEGIKTEVYIKFEDWKFNPTSFQYKTSPESETLIASIQDISEFGSGDLFKYQRLTVNIDRSSTDLQKMDYNKHPEFNEETLFLKLLVEGDANLYVYEDPGMKRYFLSTQGSKVEQLVYKEYLSTPVLIGKNTSYKQTILNALKCSEIHIDDVKALKYKEKDLTRIFTSYNKCESDKNIVYGNKDKKDFFNLSIRPGINYGTISVEDIVVSERNIDITGPVFRIGLEFEFLLPFNNDKWSVFIEPTIQNFKKETLNDVETQHEWHPYDNKVSVEYMSFEVPIGLRYYMFINSDSAIFLNAAFMQDFNKGTLIYAEERDFEFETSNNLSVGAGFKFKNKFILEARYNFGRDIDSSVSSRIEYSYVGLILGYSFL